MPDGMSKEKAKQILREGEIGGKAITEKQEGLFGLIAGGGKPTRLKDNPLHESKEKERIEYRKKMRKKK